MKKNSQRRDEGQLKSSIPVYFVNQFVSEAVVYEKAQNSKWFAAPPPDSWPPVNRRPQAVASCGSSQGVCTHTQALPGGARGEEPTCQCRRQKRCRFSPWVRKISWRRACNPLQDSCLENPMDRGAWRVTVHGVTVSSYTHTRTHTAPVHCSASACLFHLTDPLENAPYFFLIKTRPTALPSGQR